MTVSTARNVLPDPAAPAEPYDHRYHLHVRMPCGGCSSKVTEVINNELVKAEEFVSYNVNLNTDPNITGKLKTIGTVNVYAKDGLSLDHVLDQVRTAGKHVVAKGEVKEEDWVNGTYDFFGIDPPKP